MINRNFKDIYEHVGSNIQDTSSNMKTIIKRLVNDVYFDLLRRANYENIDPDYSFTASSQDNVLPSDFYKELSVYDATNNRELRRTSIQERVQNAVSLMSQTGTAEEYAILTSPVRVQPSAGAIPSVVSSDASDTTQTLYLRGEASGIEVTETISLNGTSSVNATNTYTKYYIVSKDADTAGKITVTHGTDTIAILSQEARDHKVKIMRLYCTPVSSVTINCPYMSKPLPMTEDYDVPVIDVSDIIELGATYRAWMYKRQMGKAEQYRKLYEQGIINVLWERENNPNDQHLAGVRPYTRDYYGVERCDGAT
jgi:hypothetical protein